MRLDLSMPRAGSASTRFLPRGSLYGGLLPWVIAVMVFLCGLALAGALSLSRTAQGWETELGRSLTVQIVAQDPEQRSTELEATLDLLRATPGVRAAEPLSGQEVEALLEPWLGRGNVTADLPLPALIDVELEPGTALDRAALAAKLEPVAPSARLDAHEQWLGDLLRLAATVQWLAWGVILIVIGTTVAIVIFATRASLAAHEDTIEVVHLIGATDRTIARAYQWRFLRVGLQGGGLGLLLLGLCFLLFSLFTSGAGALMPSLVPAWGVMALLVVLPFFAGLITMWTARVTVLRALSRLI